MTKYTINGKPLQFGDREQIEWLKRQERMRNMDPDKTQRNPVDIEVICDVEISFHCPNPECSNVIRINTNDAYEPGGTGWEYSVAEDEIDGMECPECESVLEYDPNRSEVSMKSNQ